MEKQTLREKAGVVAGFAAGKIARLQDGLFSAGAGAPAARASLAKLRRLGTTACDGWMSVGDQLFEGWPEEKLGQPVRSDGQPTRELLAVQAALRFYGSHQQSQKSRMAMDGRKADGATYNGAFGGACRRIEPDRTSSGGVRRRLACIEGAADFDGVLYHLRSLVVRLKSEGIPLDYYSFARDLYLLQFEAARDDVYACWARDYYLGRYAGEGPEDKSAAK